MSIQFFILVGIFFSFLLFLGCFLIGKSRTFGNYYQVLKKIHEYLKPEYYLEIGINKGRAVNLSLPTTVAYAIEPKFHCKVNSNVKVFEMKSGEFFTDKDIFDNFLSDKTFDLAFIDGMHLIGNVLNDFINVEQCCNQESIIILHDVIPISEKISTRVYPGKGKPWTCDVYKIIPILRKYRPELNIVTFDVSPSGLCFVSNLNSKSLMLKDNYDRILDKFQNFHYKDFMEHRKDFLNLVENTKENLNKILINYIK